MQRPKVFGQTPTAQVSILRLPFFYFSDAFRFSGFPLLRVGFVQCRKTRPQRGDVSSSREGVDTCGSSDRTYGDARDEGAELMAEWSFAWVGTLLLRVAVDLQLDAKLRHGDLLDLVLQCGRETAHGLRVDLRQPFHAVRAATDEGVRARARSRMIEQARHEYASCLKLCVAAEQWAQVWAL